MQKIIVELSGMICELASAETAVLAQWQRLFDNRFHCQSIRPAAVRVALMIVDSLPALPTESPTAAEHFVGGGELYAYQQENDRLALYLTRSHGMVLSVTGLSGTAAPSAQIWVRKKALADGSLEDVTMFALAPFLRRKKSFLVHAFTVAHEGGATLLVGTSGSGKTTTGLSLWADNWVFLANDVTLLQSQQDEIWAFPSPGGINIHPHTLNLLPDLAVSSATFNAIYGKYEVPVADLIANAGRRPFPVRHICLLQRCASAKHQLLPISPALALAQLMEESIDRWDEQTFADHVTVLEQVVHQAACFHLKLGRDVAGLPVFLAAGLC